MRILAIDPGSERSAWLFLDTDVGRPREFDLEPNEDLIDHLGGYWRVYLDVVVIEQIESFGMAVGREVFDTVWWAGRFAQAAQPIQVVQLPRRSVKLAICHDSRARDSNIRAALIDRFGGQSAAVGRKAQPGPLYGIAKDVWSALAIAVTYADQEGGAR